MWGVRTRLPRSGWHAARRFSKTAAWHSPQILTTKHVSRERLEAREALYEDCSFVCCLCLLIFTVMCIPMGLYFSTHGAAYRVVHGNHMDRIAEGIPEELEAGKAEFPGLHGQAFFSAGL